jgi:hypothetical protein
VYLQRQLPQACAAQTARLVMGLLALAHGSDWLWVQAGQIPAEAAILARFAPAPKPK